jgi:putative transposase
MRRRHRQLGFAGSLHFVTAVARVRGRWFVEPDECRRLLEFFEGYRAKFSVECYGYVLMPDHLHAAVYQAEAGSQVSDAIGGFKRMTSLKCRPTEYPGVSLWRDYFDDVPVPGTEALGTKLEYMFANPVRAGLVKDSLDYEWSAIRDYFERGTGIVKVTLLKK